MRTFLALYSSDKSRYAEREAFIQLASVCWNWRLTLTGWPESPTGRWPRHRLKKQIERECRCTQPRHTLLLAHLHNVCARFVVSK